MWSGFGLSPGGHDQARRGSSSGSLDPDLDALRCFYSDSRGGWSSVGSGSVGTIELSTDVIDSLGLGFGQLHI